MACVVEKQVNPAREAMDRLGERIAEQAAHLDAAMHRLLTDIREYDAGNGWHLAGAVSCAHWLSWRVGWSLATGREHVRVARRLGELKQIDEALRLGRLSYSKVRAITRVATPATEEALLVDALETTASQLETICRKVRTVHRLNRASAEEVSARRRVVRRELDDGLVKIEAVLLPDEAAAVMAAIEASARRVSAETSAADEASAAPASSPDPAASVPRPAPETVPPPAASTAASAASPVVRPAAIRATRGFDRADGLVAMAQAALRGDAPARTPVEVVVTVPAAVLRGGDMEGDPASDAGNAVSAEVGVLADGTCVSAETSRRLACDAGLVEVVEDAAGRPLSVGRRTRTLPASIKKAMLHRDRTCRFPGCTNRLFLDGHHIVHWASGGETSLDNLCALCTRHHAFLHEHGYTVEWRDSVLTFLDPRGRVVPAEPPRLPVSSLMSWAAIEAANEELAIDATTGLSRWDGQPVQYGLVVDDLCLLERLAASGAGSGGTG